MSAGFDAALVIYALGLAVVCAVEAFRSHARSPLIVPALVLIQIGTVVQAGLDVARLIDGPRPSELATHIGYLAVSIAVLPIAVGSVRVDEGRWSSMGLAIGCLVVAVVSVRLHQTLGPVRG